MEIAFWGIVAVVLVAFGVSGFVVYKGSGEGQKQEVVKTVKEREREVTRTVDRYRDEIFFEDGTDIGVEYHYCETYGNKIQYKFYEDMNANSSTDIEWEDNNRALINFDNVKYIDEIGVVAKDEFSDTYTDTEVFAEVPNDS